MAGTRGSPGCQPVGVSPFLRPDAPGLEDILADGAVAVLAERGVAGLTLAAVARWMGVTKQSLSQRLTDPAGARHRFLQLTVLAYGDRWLAWARTAWAEDPPMPALPATDDEVLGVRVWSGLAELARGEAAAGNPDPAAAVSAVQSEEREMTRHRLSTWMHAYPDGDDVTELCALVDGLRLGLAAPVPDVSLDVARRVVARRLRSVRPSAPR